MKTPQISSALGARLDIREPLPLTYDDALRLSTRRANLARRGHAHLHGALLLDLGDIYGRDVAEIPVDILSSLAVGKVGAIADLANHIVKTSRMFDEIDG